MVCSDIYPDHYQHYRMGKKDCYWLPVYQEELFCGQMRPVRLNIYIYCFGNDINKKDTYLYCIKAKWASGLLSYPAKKVVNFRLGATKNTDLDDSLPLTMKPIYSRIVFPYLIYFRNI